MTHERAFETIRCERKTATAVITLSRSDVLNALNASMFDELEAVFNALTGDPEVRVILITGSGERAFCAGADIRGLVEADAAGGEAISQRGQQVFSQIERCGIPVIACINGVALGGGCELAMACTLRLAADNARLGLPEVKLGLLPGYGGTQRLARIVGRSAALRMMLTAQIVDAAEALRLGLVDEVVPKVELMQSARDLADTIAAMAPLAVQEVLALLARQSDTSYEESMKSETAAFSRLCATADKYEGLTAFLEKRAPVWQKL